MVYLRSLHVSLLDLRCRRGPVLQYIRNVVVSIASRGVICEFEVSHRSLKLKVIEFV